MLFMMRTALPFMSNRRVPEMKRRTRSGQAMMLKYAGFRWPFQACQTKIQAPPEPVSGETAVWFGGNRC